MYKAALHLHTDEGHGMTPEKAAEAIVRERIALFATTDHSSMGNARERISRFLQTLELAEKFSKGTGLTPNGVFGTEAKATYQGEDYHLGILFRKQPTGANDHFPDFPKDGDVRKIANVVNGDALIILNHPSECAYSGWRRGKPSKRRAHVTSELVGSGLVHVVEVANAGSLIADGHIGSVYFATKTIEQSGIGSIGIVGTDDAHHPRGLGKIVTYVPDTDIKTALQAIREGDTRIGIVSKSIRDIFDKRGYSPRRDERTPSKSPGSLLSNDIFLPVTG